MLTDLAHCKFSTGAGAGERTGRAQDQIDLYFSTFAESIG